MKNYQRHRCAVCTLSKLVILGLAVGLFTLSGCSSSHIEGVTVVKNVQYPDIPAPPDAEFDGDSWDYQEFLTGPVAFRSGEVIYWKDQPVNHLASWYQSVMPAHGWKHLRTDDGTNSVVLHFEKNYEKAEVALNRAIARDREGYITRITISLGVN